MTTKIVKRLWSVDILYFNAVRDGIVKHDSQDHSAWETVVVGYRVDSWEVSADENDLLDDQCVSSREFGIDDLAAARRFANS